MEILTFSGTPRHIGRAFGESCRDEIAELYARRRNNAIARALEDGGRNVHEQDLLDLAQHCFRLTRDRYDPSGADELHGIAEGSNLSVAQIVAMNGLTDLRDVLSWPPDDDPKHPARPEGCTSFVARCQPLLCGQTWDLATDNLPFMRLVVRKPSDGPPTWSMTTVGCLSLIGMNEAGICIGNTNLLCTDSRPGVMYLSIIHKALRQHQIDDAVTCVTGAPRAGAHYYYLADPNGRAVGIECTAQRHQVRPVKRGQLRIQTNHCQVAAHQDVEAREPGPSTTMRLERMTRLLSRERLDVPSVQRAMADTLGGANAICVDDVDGYNTNGAAIMMPSERRMWVVHGNPRPHGWVAVHDQVR